MKFYTEEGVPSMCFFANSMWQSGRLGFEVPDPKTKESKASDIYVIDPKLGICMRDPINGVLN